MGLCRCLPLLVAVLLQVAGAIREDSMSEVSDVVLPKNCNNPKSNPNKCCGCGEFKKHPSREEKAEISFLWKWDAEICYVGEEKTSARVCCPRWVKECEDTDPYFFHRALKDCQPSDKSCLATECLDVAKEWQAANDKLARMKKLSKHIEEDWSETYIDGKSNNGWQFGCDCACGEHVNEDPMQCKSLNTQAWMCPDIRPCCTKLEDCDTEKDPWPLEVKARAARVKKQTTKHGTAYKAASTRKRALERLGEECVASCKLSRMSQCIDDLKSPFKERLLRKDISWEKKIELDRYEDTPTTGVSGLWVARQKDLNSARYVERNEHQLVKLPSPLFGAAPPEDVASGTRQCCACSAPLSSFKPLQGYRSKVTTICIAPSSKTCDGYKGAMGSRSKDKEDSACVALPAEFCGSATECSSDADHYSKPTTWEKA